jgi:acetyl-CoA C-acetyltransferase
MGHPLGATGAIILSTLIDELERTNKRVGVATLCAASGQAIAMVIERI